MTPGRIPDGARLVRGPAGSDALRDGLGVEEITDADVDAVIDLWRACDLTRPWNDPVRDVADARISPTATILVGRLPGSPSSDAPGPAGPPDDAPRPGDVVATAMAGYDGHRGWIYYVAVDPRVQGSGHGRTLVVAAEAWLASAGARKVQLMVRGTNAGVRAFYEGLGYADSEVVVLARWLEDPVGGAP